MRGRVLVIAGIAALVAAAPARAATYTVTGTADGTGDCSGTSCSTLRAAVTAANTAGGANAIKLGAATYNLSGALTVTSQLTVAGGSAATTAVSEDGKSGRVFIVSGAGKLTVAHATVSNGFAEAAGDIGGNIAVAQNTQLVLDHVRVTGGASLRGGGIAIQGGTSVTITHSLIDNNQAVSLPGVTSGQGGGIMRIGNVKLAPSTLSITDSTVTGNTASTRAGIAVSADAADSTTLTRSTVAFNSAGSTDGGPGIDVAADGGTFTATGSIIAGNTGDGVQFNCQGTLTSGGGNVDSGSTCGLATATDVQGKDPGLGGLTATGGETPVLPITATSPAVDLTSIKDAACTGTDQRDLARPQGAGCDAGAYEVDQPPDTTIDSGLSGTIATPSNTFTFSSPEPGATFECKLDGPGTTTGVYDVCTSATGYGRLADGTYTFSVRAVDGTGNTDATPATRTFTVDTTPPDTTLGAGGPSGATNITSPSFTFSSTERAATFQCKLDGPGATTGTFAACAPPKAYSGLADGAYTFSVRALDSVGNADATPATRSFTVDTVAPNTTIISEPADRTNNKSPSHGFTSSQAGSTFECKLDGPGGVPGTYAACTSPKVYGPLADGAYTFSVRAIDPAKNVDASPAMHTFTVDTAVPDTSITSGPTGTIATDAASFGFTSPDAIATFQCKLDGPGATPGTYAACTSPKAYSSLADGAYTFSVRAVDGAGNIDATPAARSFTVDASAPDTTITSGPTGTTGSASPSFGFSSDDASATFECALDGPGTATGAFASCASPKAYSGLADGSYTFRVRAVDPAGNVDTDPSTRAFAVDTSPPHAAIVSGPSGETDNASPSFAFSAAETGTTFDCRLDGPGGAVHAYGPCTSPKSFAALAPGDYMFFVRARDAAGNAAVTSRPFTVEAPPPPPPPGPKPKPHQTVVVAPATGRTLIKLPGHKRFTKLDATKGIPLGSIVDTLHGRVRLSAIRRAGEPLETALFYGGVFKVTQTSKVTQLSLVQRLTCSAPAKKASAARKRVTKRRLWGSGKGRFRTRGQYSSATVRGTKWLVQDSCGKTLTRVARGIVAVQDFVRHRTVLVRAGHRYTARKRG